MNKKEFFKDGGYKSRKFWLAVFAIITLLAAPHLCPAVALTDVVAGIVAIVTVYMGGNAVSRWNMAKALPKALPKEPDENEEGC